MYKATYRPFELSGSLAYIKGCGWSLSSANVITSKLLLSYSNWPPCFNNNPTISLLVANTAVCKPIETLAILELRIASIVSYLAELIELLKASPADSRLYNKSKFIKNSKIFGSGFFPDSAM